MSLSTCDNWIANPKSNMEDGRAARLRDLASTWGSITTKQKDSRAFYTFKKPHTCVHCQRITVDCSVLSEEVGSRWTGGGADPAALVQLDYNLEEVFEAARQGCSLYVWLLEGLLIEGKGKFQPFLEDTLSGEHHFSLYFWGSETITVYVEWGNDSTKEFVCGRNTFPTPLSVCAEERKYFRKVDTRVE